MSDDEAPFDTGALLRSPLHDVHVDLGARLVPFAGWAMPLAYAGTLAEHRAVRSSAGLFDVSHMGQVRLRGEHVEVDLRRLCAGRFDRIVEPGAAVYSLLVTEPGGIVDDLIAYRIAPDEVLVVCNASNRELVARTLAEGASPSTEVDDVSSAWAMLALQGPESLDVLAGLGVDISAAPSFTFVDAVAAGHSCIVATTGYTGERGCELLVDPAGAADVWNALVADTRVQPCGLGARDTLRLEACFPLHGSDIDAAHDVVTSSLGWTVDWNETRCIAYDALVAVRDAGPAERLVPLLATGRGVPRTGCDVVDPVTGVVVGYVTSGTFGPSVGSGIALARVRTTSVPGSDVPDPSAIGTALAIDVRGRPVPCTVVRRPFPRPTPAP